MDSISNSRFSEVDAANSARDFADGRRSKIASNQIRPVRKGMTRENSTHTATSIHYHGVTLQIAASQGSLPLFALLWGMGKAKKINFMVPDTNGNNPLHHAVLAESSDVVTFIFGQTKGWLNSDCRLVDSRNQSGETPLLRAATVGKISIMKQLLDEGSDPCIQDYYGNTVFTNLSKYAHLWCLHYVYVYIRDRYSENTAINLLNIPDFDGHTCLDWAADSGSVNILEYLIRRGMTVYRIDQHAHGPLYWAAKSKRVSALKFLLKCGLNPMDMDIHGQSPHKIIHKSRDHEMIATLRVESQKSIRSRNKNHNKNDNNPHNMWSKKSNSMNQSPESQKNSLSRSNSMASDDVESQSNNNNPMENISTPISAGTESVPPPHISSTTHYSETSPTNSMGIAMMSAQDGNSVVGGVVVGGPSSTKSMTMQDDQYRPHITTTTTTTNNNNTAPYYYTTTSNSNSMKSNYSTNQYYIQDTTNQTTHSSTHNQNISHQPISINTNTSSTHPYTHNTTTSIAAGTAGGAAAVQSRISPEQYPPHFNTTTMGGMGGMSSRQSSISYPSPTRLLKHTIESTKRFSSTSNYALMSDPQGLAIVSYKKPSSKKSNLFSICTNLCTKKTKNHAFHSPTNSKQDIMNGQETNQNAQDNPTLILDKIEIQLEKDNKDNKDNKDDDEEDDDDDVDVIYGSHAISRMNETRSWVAITYTTIYLIYWMLTLCIPFYVWILIVCGSFVLYRQLTNTMSDAKKKKAENHQLTIQQQEYEEQQQHLLSTNSNSNITLSAPLGQTEITSPTPHFQLLSLSSKSNTETGLPLPTSSSAHNGPSGTFFHTHQQSSSQYHTESTNQSIYTTHTTLSTTTTIHSACSSYVQTLVFYLSCGYYHSTTITSSTNTPLKPYKTWKELCSLQSLPNFILNHFHASEKYIGAHTCLFVCYIYYWVSCLCHGLYMSNWHNAQSYLSNYYSTQVNPNIDLYFDYTQSFRIGALSGGKNDMELLYILLGLIIVTLGIWIKLAWLYSDPGSIDTRYQDFDIIMDKSIIFQGPPPRRYCCPTTLMLKPLRSKYDTASGLLVARMDHYCIWLNNTIGYKNHRLFIVFLLSQWCLSASMIIFIIRAMHRELGAICGIAENLVGVHYLFPTCLLIVSILVVISLSVLLYEQITNIFLNQTVNEKMNYSRYPWMMDDEGRLCSKFNQGWYHNLCEFLQLPRYKVDYMSLYELPSSMSPSTPSPIKITSSPSTKQLDTNGPLSAVSTPPILAPTPTQLMSTNNSSSTKHAKQSFRNISPPKYPITTVSQQQQQQQQQPSSYRHSTTSPANTASSTTTATSTTTGSTTMNNTTATMYDMSSNNNTYTQMNSSQIPIHGQPTSQSNKSMYVTTTSNVSNNQTNHGNFNFAPISMNQAPLSNISSPSYNYVYNTTTSPNHASIYMNPTTLPTPTYNNNSNSNNDNNSSSVMMSGSTSNQQYVVDPIHQQQQGLSTYGNNINMHSINSLHDAPNSNNMYNNSIVNTYNNTPTYSISNESSGNDGMVMSPAYSTPDTTHLIAQHGGLTSVPASRKAELDMLHNTSLSTSSKSHHTGNVILNTTPNITPRTLLTAGMNTVMSNDALVSRDYTTAMNNDNNNLIPGIYENKNNTTNIILDSQSNIETSAFNDITSTAASHILTPLQMLEHDDSDKIRRQTSSP